MIRLGYRQRRRQSKGSWKKGQVWEKLEKEMGVGG